MKTENRMVRVVEKRNKRDFEDEVSRILNSYPKSATFDVNYSYSNGMFTALIIIIWEG